MLRRLKEFLTRIAHSPAPAPIQQYPQNIEEFSVESLWDDYEKRTWNYDYTQKRLGRTDPRLLNWVGSIDHSGYTREKCLRYLVTNYQPGDENRILLRLADWVPQIQLLARAWTFEHFRLLPLVAICDNQRLLLYLSRKKRLQDDAGLNEITRDLLERTGSIGREQFFDFTAMFRRFVFSLSIAEHGHLRPWILDDPEPFNRLLLLNEVEFSQLTKDELEKFGADKSVFVRRRFCRTRIDAGTTPSRANLISLALDPNRSLRMLGQFYLKDIYNEDAYTIYRARGGEEFFYIVDYGRKEDAVYFLEGIRSGSIATQCNCLRALAVHAPEQFDKLDLLALISQSRKFRAILLPILPLVLSLDAILGLRSAFTGSSAHDTVSFLRMLEKKSFWTFVDEGIEVLLSDPPSLVSEAIINSISSRVQIFESLSAESRERISGKIARLRNDPHWQNEGIVSLLEFTMKTA